MSENLQVMQGGCDCGHVRYELQNQPLFVHCCHCTWCQRETGAAFALNALIEATEIKLINHQAVLVETPSESGGGQKIARCPQCQVALWSHYGGMGEFIAFVKVGTLDQAHLVQPDVHIYTQSKLTWLELPQKVPAFERYYSKQQLWPAESLQRLNDARIAKQ